MKRQKKLLLLCLAFALLLGCYGLVTLLTAPEDTTDEPDTGISLGISDGLSAMGWKYEDVEVNLLLSDSTWVSADDADCPIDQELVQELIDTAVSLDASRVVEDPEDVTAFGFDAEEAVTLFFTKDSTITTLTIGNTDPLNGSAYVMLNGDSSRVYLVDTSELKAFVLTIYDLVDKEDLPTFSDVLSLELSGKNNLEVVFVDGGSDQCYTELYEWFLQQGSSLLPLDTDAAEDLMEELTTLTWGDCVNYKADAAALSDYGLDAPLLTLSVLCNEGSTGSAVELEFGKYDQDSGSYYARLAESNMVYLVSSSIYNTLTEASYDDLRAMDVLLVDWYDVKDLEITLDGATAAMNIVTVTGTDGLSSLMYDLDESAVDTELGSAFLNSISGMTATETGKTADGDPALTISLRLRTSADRLALTFAPSGEGYVVQLDGAGDLWITADQYKTIIDAYAAMCAD